MKRRGGLGFSGLAMGQQGAKKRGRFEVDDDDDGGGGGTGFGAPRRRPPPSAFLEEDHEEDKSNGGGADKQQQQQQQQGQEEEEDALEAFMAGIHDTVKKENAGLVKKPAQTKVNLRRDII